MSAIHQKWKKVALKVTNTTQSLYLIKKNIQFLELSEVNPEENIFINPVDTETPSSFPEADTELTTYVNELLRTSKPEQQSNRFWLPKPKYHIEKSYFNTDTKPQKIA